MDGWILDEHPLFDVSLKRTSGSLELDWQPLPEDCEYILYRNATADPLSAVEIVRTTANTIVDSTTSTETCYYWLVGVHKLERTWNNSVTYANVPVATNKLCKILPASMRMEVSP